MPDVFVASKKKSSPLPSETSGVTSGILSVPSKKLGRLRSLSAYLVQPSAVTFETQESDEEIILLLRKHVITNLPWVTASILLFFLPFLFPLLNPIFDISAIPFRFQVVGIVVWYLITFSLAFQNFLNWYYNVYIVTDHRVVDTDFFSLLYKHISDAPLENIQDISYSMGGVGSALFNYGNVYIQTAAEVPDFRFDAVPTPDKVVRTITSLMESHGLHMIGKKA
jgi:hypothetical protein